MSMTKGGGRGGGMQTAPKGQTSHLSQNVLQAQKGVIGCLRYKNDPGTLSYSFFLSCVTSLDQPNTYTENCDRRQGKGQLFLLPFLPAFLTRQVPKGESVGASPHPEK